MPESQGCLLSVYLPLLLLFKYKENKTAKQQHIKGKIVRKPLQLAFSGVIMHMITR